MRLRRLKNILFAALAVFCLAELMHCDLSGREQCAKAGCSVHCCLTARVSQTRIEIAEPATRPEYRPIPPETQLSHPLPEDIFHPPAA